MRRPEKFQKRILIRLGFTFILLVLYLVNANGLFRVLIKTDPEIRSITQEEFERMFGDDYVVLEWSKEPEISDDFFKSMLLDGVLFCENDTFSTDKVYGIVLKSSEDIYLFSVPARNGKTAMENKQSAGFRLISDNILLKAKIPTVMLENGEYQLYLYNYENDSVFGMCNTGLRFIKEGDSFRQYLGHRVKNLKDVQFGNVGISIDRLEKTGLSQMEVYGWANEASVDVENQKVFIEFYNDPFSEPVATYQCVNIRRSGLGEYFGEDRYDYSGFQLSVEMPEVEDIFYLRLVIEDQNKSLRSNIRLAYKYADGAYEMIQWRNTSEDQMGDISTLAVDDAKGVVVENPYSELVQDFRYNYSGVHIEKEDEERYRFEMLSAVMNGSSLTIEGKLYADDYSKLADAKVILDILCKDRSSRAYYPKTVNRIDYESGEPNENGDGKIFTVVIPSEYVGEHALCHLLVDGEKRVHIADFQIERTQDGQVGISEQIER